MANLHATIDKLIRAAALRGVAARKSTILLFGLFLLWAAPVMSAMADEAVFVLGEDPQDGSGYFGAAETYYRHAMPGARTVTALRSLAEVREYLVRNRGETPWTRIVLVAHGSPWGGLLVPLYSGGSRASLAVLEDAVATREFPGLPSGVIAADGRVVVESCGLGRRDEYLRALAELFKTDDGSAPRVEAAQGFVVFYAPDTGVPQRWELPIAVRLFRGNGSGRTDGQLAHEAERLRATLPNSQANVSRHPIEVIANYAGINVGDARQAERLAASDPKVLRQLHSLGISAGSLRWSSETIGNDRGIRVRGEGVALIAYGEKPASLLP